MDASTHDGSLFTRERMAFFEPVSRLFATNPFDPAWEHLHAAALRDHYIRVGGDGGASEKNRRTLAGMVAMRLSEAAQRIRLGAVGTETERAAYRGAVVYHLWDEFGPKLQQIIDADGVEAPFYDAFANTYHFFLDAAHLSVPEPAHLFALLYQARRAWHFASTWIGGASSLAEATRAAIWRAVLGSDPVAYAAGRYRRFDGIPVLITGETGTGKELTAQSIGWSRYVPFEEKARRFSWKYAADYHVRNIRDASADLLASTLFGHRRGAFTGALADATGYFGLTREHGTLFLDEIGELLPQAQIMLLRVLQGREFVVVGDTKPTKMQGRPICATNRDLEAMCALGLFREDLLERMNGMRIHMPSLLQILAQAPGEIWIYVARFVAECADDPAREQEWTERIVRSIAETLPCYAWPRNMRELRNHVDCYILTDGHMPSPAARAPAADRGADGDDEAAPQGQRAPVTQFHPKSELLGPEAEEPGAPVTRCSPSSGLLGPEAKAGKATVEEVTRDLVTRTYFLTGGSKKTAQMTGIDRRAVGPLINQERLARLRAAAAAKTDDES